MPRPLLALVPIAALAACAPQPEGPPPPTEPAAKVVGAAENCIQSQQIRTSRVRDDRTIDFEMRGGRVYRNTLPNSCPRLGFEEAFTYNTSLTRLCSTEIIYVLDTVGGQLQRGAGCGLGQFVPVEYLED